MKHLNVETMKVVPSDNKGQRGGLGNLIGIAIGLVIASIVVAFGAKVTNDISGGLSSGSVAKAAVDNGTASMGNLAAYMPTIATVGAAAVIISFLIGAFAFGRK